ncbi:putative ribonuclease H-like domain-containing protein [Tanacetum coccineum]
MRPFRCPVTILNTIDHLGKFDGKAGEEFFVGYSTNSKAFRVFNSRTRIVEKNLHVKFSEETPNIAGSGPKWLFDIDTLTKSMNYEPVVTGNQSNGSPGTKACDDADSSDAGFKPSGDEEKKDDKHTENEDSKVPNAEEPRVNQEQDANVNSTNTINTISLTINATGIEDNAVDKKADMTNLDTNIPVSPIPTTKIHKDHPVEQIIGDLHSAPQTRRMTNNVTNHVARIEEIRLFLAYASFKDFVVYQIDVKSAFLYGKIEEEVYVCQPPGAWYETLSTYLLDNGFHKGQIDKTLFIKRVKGDILLVQVYVNDIIFGSIRKEMCTEFEKMMHKKFQISSMGELTFFLGLQVTQKDDVIFISQDKYVDEILNKFGFSTMKTTSTPMETSKPLLKDAEAKDVDVHLYRSMIGSLMYLTTSRPDIMFVVCACARFQVTPKVSHLYAVKRIFRYLKDLLTKAFDVGKFQYLIASIGMLNL